MDATHQARITSNGTRLAVYEIKEVYGRPLAYPINDQAEHIQDLSGFKTLRPSDISTIQSLGFQVVTIHGENIQPSMLN